MSLVQKIIRTFTRRNIQVLMMEDFPSVGFEGQVVNVKPGYARQSLIPKNLAVYNFPGVRERLFPNIRQADIDQKIRYYRDLTNFQNKVDNINLEFFKVPSFANPALLKEEINKKDIIREVQNRFSIELKNENVFLEENIQRFGTYSINVRDFYNADLQRKFEFVINVQVKQPVVREAREEKETKESKDAKKETKAAETKQAKGKESKSAKDKEDKTKGTKKSK
ncbi:hypothetical protein ABPG72_010571 [Tetrahymena utriculariae]